MPTQAVEYVKRPYVRSGRLADLIRDRGRSAADAELRRGDISANMWSNLGQTFAGTLSSLVRDRADAPRRQFEALQLEDATGRIHRDRAIRDVGRLTQGDPDAYAREVGLIDPERGRVLEAGQREQRYQLMTQIAQRLHQQKNVFGRTAQMLAEVETRPDLYPQMRPHLVELAGSVTPELASEIPDTYDPTSVRGLLQFASGAAEQTAKRERGLYLLHEGEQELDNTLKRDKLYTESLSSWLSTATSQEDWDSVLEMSRGLGMPEETISRFGGWSPDAPARASRMGMTAAQRASADGTGAGGSDYSAFLARWARERGIGLDKITRAHELEARAEFYEAGRAPRGDGSGRRGSRGQDDPKFPRGVENYLVEMKRRGYSRADAEAEVFTDATWRKLQADHPDISGVTVQQGINRLFPADDLGAGGGAGAVFGANGSPAPATPPPPAGGPRTATLKDVQKVAQRKGITVAQARQQLEAAGVVIR